LVKAVKICLVIALTLKVKACFTPLFNVVFVFSCYVVKLILLPETKYYCHYRLRFHLFILSFRQQGEKQKFGDQNQEAGGDSVKAVGEVGGKSQLLSERGRVCALNRIYLFPWTRHLNVSESLTETF
jgi:hypothetical protein